MDKVLRNIFKNNLKVKKTEKLLILTDIQANPNKKERNINFIAEKAAEIAKEFTKNVFLLKYPAVGRHSGPLPKVVEVAMLDSDVILGITRFSTTHTKPSIAASRRGARVATTPGIEKHMLEKGGSVDVDYRKMSKRCMKIVSALKGKKVIRILGKGTDVSLSIKGRKFEPDDGMFRKKLPGNLPAGEVMGAPVESSANGIVTSNCPKAVIWFKDGKVVEFIGDSKLKDDIMKYAHRRTIAELGIGTNPNAKNPENGLEAEKILGTIHIAVGENTDYPGGKNRSDMHRDFVVFKPTVTVDGKTLIKKGKLLI